jgi:2-amino-4-hydroxy-6-hydroxymethyldihydropteridine diphosphokinase
MTAAVVALGSNLGDRARLLADAVAAIADLDGVELTAVSPFYESAALKPHGVDDDAPAYLNAVLLADVDLTPEQLLEQLMAIEQRFGRVRVERWGDRTLDLDIVVFGDERRDAERLQLPHPRAHERHFVLRPWLDIDPAAELPGHGRVADLVAGMEAGA